MAQTSWPFESIDTSETQFSQWARNIGEGVKGSSLGTELKVTAGTGLQVNVAAGQAMVRGHYYSSNAVETLTHSAANATNPRIDAVVLELDPTANTILLKIVTGTAAGSPVAPTLTQTDAGVWQQLLATVLIAAGSSAVNTVTDARTFLGSVAATRVTTTVSDKSGNYTLTSADKNTMIRATGSTAATITVNNVLTVGESIEFIQAGAGQLTFAAGPGVTIYSADNNLKTAKQYAFAGLFCGASGVYYLTGQLGA